MYAYIDRSSCCEVTWKHKIALQVQQHKFNISYQTRQVIFFLQCSSLYISYFNGQQAQDRHLKHKLSSSIHIVSLWNYATYGIRASYILIWSSSKPQNPYISLKQIAYFNWRFFFFNEDVGMMNICCWSCIKCPEL